MELELCGALAILKALDVMTSRPISPQTQMMIVLSPIGLRRSMGTCDFEIAGDFFRVWLLRIVSVTMSTLNPISLLLLGPPNPLCCQITILPHDVIP